MMGFGGLGMILWLVLLVAVVVIATRLASGGGDDGSANGQEPDALEILRRRYAGGEISREEYEEKRRDLA